ERLRQRRDPVLINRQRDHLREMLDPLLRAGGVFLTHALLPCSLPDDGFMSHRHLLTPQWYAHSRFLRTGPMELTRSPIEGRRHRPCKTPMTTRCRFARRRVPWLTTVSSERSKPTRRASVIRKMSASKRTSLWIGIRKARSSTTSRSESSATTTHLPKIAMS